MVLQENIWGEGRTIFGSFTTDMSVTLAPRFLAVGVKAECLIYLVVFMFFFYFSVC